MSLILASLLLGPPSGDPGADPEGLMREALEQADPAQLAAMDALSRIDADVLERLENTEKSALESLMMRRLRGETLSPEDEALVQANITVSVAGFDSTLDYQRGSAELPEGLGRIELGQSFRFLDARNAQRVLSEAWGNPAKPETIGMLVPPTQSVVHPLEGWGIRIAYRADGWVDDADAGSFDPDAALLELKAQLADGEAAPMKVVGWAQAPHYDVQSKVMTWGVEYASTEDDRLPHSINYVSRFLTRGGVLEFSSVASDAQGAVVVAAMAELPRKLQLAPGQTHADYRAGDDPAAPYTVADLMRGGGDEVDAFSGVKRVGPLVLLGLFAWFYNARRRKRSPPAPSS